MFRELMYKVEGTIFGLTVACTGLAIALAYVEHKDNTKLKEENKYLRSLIDKPEENYDHN